MTKERYLSIVLPFLRDYCLFSYSFLASKQDGEMQSTYIEGSAAVLLGDGDTTDLDKMLGVSDMPQAKEEGRHYVEAFSKHGDVIEAEVTLLKDVDVDALATG